MFLISLTIEFLTVVLGLLNGRLRQKADNNLAGIFYTVSLWIFLKNVKRLFAIKDSILRMLLKDGPSCSKY